MRKYVVLTIEEIIHRHKEIKRQYQNIVTIMITTQKYHYSFTPNAILDFLDVNKSQEGFITENQVEKIKILLPTLRKANLIVVSCDGGISRSPAVAASIAKYFKDWKEYEYIRTHYPYMNIDVYEFVIKKMM